MDAKYRIVKEWCSFTGRYKYYPERRGFFGLIWLRYDDPRYQTIRRRYDTFEDAERFLKRGEPTPHGPRVVWTDIQGEIKND